LKGLLPKANFSNPESFNQCEAGDKITVNYFENDQQKLLFTEANPIDVCMEYVGKTVPVKVLKAEDTSLSFWVEGKYKASLPVTKLIYPAHKNSVRKHKARWKDGEILDCEVLDYKPQKGLIIKWIYNEEAFNDWHTDEILNYIGKVVNVNVSKVNGKTIYLIENKYPAVLIGLKGRNKTAPDFFDGDVIQCKVRTVNFDEHHFRIKLIEFD
jgi:hypothetical protein